MNFFLTLTLTDITVPVPSLFFIKSNGVLIKMVSSKDTSDISRAINDIFEKKKAHKIKKAEPEEKNSLGKERNSNILSGQENCK